MRGNSKPAGGTFPRFSVFTCNVILRRYSLLEVPRRRIHNAIAKAMAICVAFGNKVMDTRLPQPAGCGDKYDVCSVGRSMIEMLGVLAIIAVLTVGGIAGYSKAMEKFKVNKTVKEYSYVIQGLLEYKDNILKNATEKQTFLTNFLYSAHIIPDSWKIIENSRDAGIHDSYGNDVYFYSFKNSDDKIIISTAIYLGGESKDENNKRISNFSPKLCFELLNNLVKPLHSVLYSGGITEWNSKISFPFGGDNYCGKETTCLNDLSLQKIQQICNSCTEGYCAVVLRFI